MPRVNGYIQRDTATGDLYYLQGSNDIEVAKVSDIPVVTPVSFTAFGSTPNANGASVSGGAITLEPVSSSFPGGVTSAMFNTWNAKESALTFGTGLARATNTITNNLSTGVSGGQAVVGSTSTNSGLIVKATTGVGSTGADITFNTGNNGSYEAARIKNNTSIIIGSSNPSALFDRSLTIINDAATSPLPTRAGYADFKLQTFNNGVNTKFSNLQISTNRGTEASSTMPQSGDLIGSVYFGANRDGTDEFYSGPIVQAYATENWVYNSTRGSKLVFGSGVQGTWVGSNVMTIGSNENVGIGNGVTESAYRLGVMGGSLGVGNNTPTTFTGNYHVSVGGDSGSSLGGIVSTRYDGTDAIRMGNASTFSYINEPRNLPLEFRTNGTVGLTQLANQNITSAGSITAPSYIANNYSRHLPWLPNFTGATGTSLELFYNSSSDEAFIQSYDRTNSISKPMSIRASVVAIPYLSGATTRMMTVGTNGELGASTIPGGGGGSVTGVAVATANGLAGTSDGAAVVPTLTLRTTVSGILKGNGTAISAATPMTDYLTGSAGTYTPTVTALTNCTIGTVTDLMHTRVGNIVTVTGRVVINTTSLGTSTFAVSLPIASNFTAATDLSGYGTMAVLNSAGQPYGLADTSNDRATFSIQSGASGAGNVYLTFTYIVL